VQRLGQVSGEVAVRRFAQQLSGPKPGTLLSAGRIVCMLPVPTPAFAT